jgi:hypothetical protein
MASAAKVITFSFLHHSPSIEVIAQESLERLIRVRILFEQVKDSLAKGKL